MKYFAYSQKQFVYKYVVMLSDSDQFKHMSFANYLKLTFLASDALLVGCFDREFLNCFRNKIQYSKMQFKRQSVPGENILIKINSSSILKNNYSLLFTFVIEGTGELVGLCKQSYVVIDLLSNSPVDDFGSQIRGVLEPIQVSEENLIYKY